MSATDNGDPKPWLVHGEKIIYDNPWVRLTLADVEPPGFKRFEHHVVRLYRVAVAAIIDEDERVLMMWRYRFVPRRFGWELPGGIIDAGENGADAAAREVEEETGWRPNKPLRHLLTFQPMVGMVDSPHELYLGHGAQFIAAPAKDSEEAARVAWISLSDIAGMIERDELLGAGTLVALLHTLAFTKVSDR
jgi:8-oxo-dGTP pyrophosphatase MutT (NUDIX family)